MFKRKYNEMHNRPFIVEDVYWFNCLSFNYLLFFYDNRNTKLIHKIRECVIDECELRYRS